jgi:FKBP-type peptidyl-prolyl cis-trans isomerase 2
MRSPGSIPVLPVVLIVATLVVAASLGAYLAYFSDSHEPSGQDSILIANGDEVSVDYIGMFEDGTVFDTSMVSVADDNTNYTKAQSFPAKTSYSPITFIVGSGTMIKGFETGVIGMSPGQTKEIIVKPEDGYGASDPLLIKTLPLTEELPVYIQGVKNLDFAANYSEAAGVGVVVAEKFWGWNMTIHSVDTSAGMMTLKRLPDVGKVISPYKGWTSSVVSIDESANGGMGIIRLRHDLDAGDVNRTSGIDSGGLPFRIVSLDASSGTFTIDSNKEVAGRTLYYRVTIVSVTKSAAQSP